MIDGTFAFIRGMGPSRERELWRAGILSWSDFPAEGTVLSPRLDDRIREGMAHLGGLLAARRFDEIARILPVRDHWRLLAHLEAQATYLDIETARDGRVAVIGLYDAARGPRLYVRGHNLGAFVEEPAAIACVTFNGGAYDLPMLQKTFPRWTPPVVHVDLRTVVGQLREKGGLKQIEDRVGIGRPLHLKGVGGLDAVRLWTEFEQTKSIAALRLLLEYNLYDVVQLRALAQIACARLAARCSRTWAPVRKFERGDVLLDLSRAVEAIVDVSRSIVPDAVDDEERVALRAC